jgi:hypothetical protein
VLTREKLNDTGARLEHTAIKSLIHLAQETRVSKSSDRRVTQSLKLRPHKTSIIYALQLYNPDSRIHFCSLFLQSVAEGL